MASLTPGVLLKLLQSMNTDTKVAGEHRSSVLQVTAIVPATTSSDDLLRLPHSFYLQLSDSLHSTYVALSDPDAAAVLLSRPQLGQLVLVDRFLFSPSAPLPRAAGLRPIPFSSRSPPPFSSNPQSLVARLAADGKSFIIQPTSDNEVPKTRAVFAAKENVVSVPLISDPTINKEKRRFSSPAGARKFSGEKRDPSSAVKTRSRPSSPASRAGCRSSSPVPSKCEVPSLRAAKEENRRSAREPAIIVPSRYRQPSPVGSRRAAASPVGRRVSGSPGRRFSGVMKMSPATGESRGRKKVAAVIAGIPKLSEALMGSSRSIRKSWEDSSANSGSSTDSNKKAVSKKEADHHSTTKTQVSVTQQRLSDASDDHSSSEGRTFSENPRQTKKPETSLYEKSKFQIPKIHDKWTDGSIPWDCISDNLARLGKETIQRRNMASAAAAESLEEACVSESVIRCMSMFSDLCSSSKLENPLPTIDQFMSIYDDAIKCTSLSESLSRSCSGINDTLSVERRKCSNLWVEAALATDLRVVSLVSTGEKPEVPSSGPPRASSLSKRNAPEVPEMTSNTWSRGSGVSGTLVVSRTLKHDMEIWFLKFVEDAVDVGFWFNEKLDGGEESAHTDKAKVAAVLSHLKRVNEWLDGVGRKPENEALVEMIERLKHKIYGFVISNVGSAFDSSVAISM